MKIKDVVNAQDLRFVAKRLLEKNGGGRDLIADEFSAFTSDRPAWVDAPPQLIEDIAAWLGDMPVAPEED